MPFKLGDKKLTRDGLTGIKFIEDPYLKMNTRYRLANFMDGLTYGISRNEYVDSGLENALRRLMIFANSGENMLQTLGGLNLKAMGDHIISKCKFTLLCNAYVSTVDNNGFFKTFLKVITNNDKATYNIDFNDKVKKAIADAAEDYINNNDEAKKTFSKYPGKVDQAVSDIRVIVNTVLKGVTSIDSVATIAIGAPNLTHNHSFIQSLA